MTGKGLRKITIVIKCKLRKRPSLFMMQFGNMSRSGIIVGQMVAMIEFTAGRESENCDKISLYQLKVVNEKSQHNCMRWVPLLYPLNSSALQAKYL